MNGDKNIRHTGGCQCGAVRYVMTADPNPPSICHCRMCQKAVGGPFAVFCSIADDKLQWTRGAPAKIETSPVSERGFCASCGTPLTYAATGNGRTSVTVYSLDTPQAIATPHREIGVESRVAWLDDISALPKLTTTGSADADFLSECRSFQHPDHDTPADWTSPKTRTDS